MIEIKTEKGAKRGKIHIVSENEGMTGEDILNRILAITNLLKAVDLELINGDEVAAAMCILEDYLPNHEQINQMFEALEKQKSA